MIHIYIYGYACAHAYAYINRERGPASQNHVARDAPNEASVYASLLSITQVQLLAAPKSDRMSISGAARWSALVMDGVAVPYEEVVGIRMVESAHEFIVEHR